MHTGFRPIAGALADFRAAGLPLAGALRLSALHGSIGAPTAALPHFAAACAALGHSPSWAELRALLAAGGALTPQLLTAGARLTRAGDPATGLWIVHHGQLIARPAGRSGGPMTVFGPREGLDRGVWIDSIYASRAGVALFLPRDEVDALVAECPIAAVGLDIGLSRALRDTTTAPPAS